MNSLWISSLAISITSALLATLLQQWIRRHVKVTQPLGSAHKRARIRHYIFNGVSNAHFLWATDAVPVLLHLSVFLFFAGLLILLRHINHTVFNAVVAWVVLCIVVYAYITVLPIFKPGNPHFAPLSSLVWQVYAKILYPLLESLSSIIGRTRSKDVRRPAARLLKRLEEKVEEIILDKSESPKLDADILESLLVTLDDDGARERFFEAIPGFYDSEVVHVRDVKEKISESSVFYTNFRRTVNQFLDQTLSSDLVSELDKCRRILTCLNATYRVLGRAVAVTSITHQIIRSWNWNAMMPLSPEIGHILKHWSHSADSTIAYIGHCTIARIIARVEVHDDTWMALARSQLKVTEDVLKGYLEHGDSVLLANLIKTTHLFFEKDLPFQQILWSLSQFKVKETLPELQHAFCALWDEIVEKSNQSYDCVFILDEIRHVYDALHPTTPATAAASPTTDEKNSLPLGSSYAPHAYRQFDNLHHTPSTSSQPATASTSSPSPLLGFQPVLPPLQGDETENQHVSPAILATPRDVSVSGPGVIVDASEHDVQYMDAHDPH